MSESGSETKQQGKRPIGELDDRFDRLIRETKLGRAEEEWLRLRWLERLARLNKNTNFSRKWVYGLRGTSLVSALIVPALVSLNVSKGAWVGPVHTLTIVLSLVAAISASLLELFRFGPRWQLYRHYGAELEAEGWQFFELEGKYAGTYQAAFPKFVANVEATIRRYETDYINEVTLGRGGADGSTSRQSNPG